VRRLLTLAALLALAAPATAEARKPIVSYVDEAGQFRLYDLELAQELPPPAVEVPAGFLQFRWGMSPGGRYVVFNDEDFDLHLLDRATNTELPLPGIDIDVNPGSLSASDTGLVAFDANGNGPARVYDSAAQAFVDTGLAADNGHRQTRLSGNGRYLATTCLSGCEVDLGSDSNPYVQALTTRQDTGFPDDDDFDEEHPCIDADGSLVGLDLPGEAAGDRDVVLFDRSVSPVAPLALAGLNDADQEDTFCVLDGAGDHVGLLHDDTELRIYERASGSFLALPPDKEFDQRSTFSAPYPPPGGGGPGGGGPGPGGGGPPATDLTAPGLRGLVMSRRVFAVGRGTVFHYRLSEPATVRIAIQRRAAGRRKGGRCRRPSRRLRGRPRCVRWIAIGAIVRRGLPAGPAATRFSGRIGRRALRPGGHRAVLRATDAAGNRSAAQRVTFWIVRP